MSQWKIFLFCHFSFSKKEKWRYLISSSLLLQILAYSQALGRIFRCAVSGHLTNAAFP